MSVSDILERLVVECQYDWYPPNYTAKKYVDEALAELKALMESTVPNKKVPIHDNVPRINAIAMEAFNQARKETLANIRKAFE